MIKQHINKFESILLGSLLVATSIVAFSQNANAAELKHQHDNLNRNLVAVEYERGYERGRGRGYERGYERGRGRGYERGYERGRGRRYERRADQY